jgi:hypothetical protein
MFSKKDFKCWQGVGKGGGGAQRTRELGNVLILVVHLRAKATEFVLFA